MIQTMTLEPTALLWTFKLLSKYLVTCYVFAHVCIRVRSSRYRYLMLFFFIFAQKL